MIVLADEKLKKLATHRLVGHLRAVTARISAIEHYYGPRCCEICHEYIGDDWEKDVGQYSRPYREYLAKIKVILATREDLRKTPKWRKYKKRNRQ